MADTKNEYGENFRAAVARIEKLPATERSAMSNRPTASLPKPAPRPPKRTA
jgi:hypothetical protein